MTPNGTLTRKAGRQVSPNRSALTRRPPTTRPATEPSDSTAPYADKALARAAPLNRIWMRLMICGTMTAAPAP
jgi:hypothetical protein